MKNILIKIKNRNSGYTMMELLFYVSFFAVLSLLVVNSMIIMTSAFREASIQSELARSGGIMERISREIRQSRDISSITASHLGLQLQGGSGNATFVEFLLTDGNIELSEGGVSVGNLNSPNVVVEDLAFVEINTGRGQAVKTILSVRVSNDPADRVIDFHSTVVLRGGY